MGRRRRRITRQQRVQRQRQVWDLRQQGWAQARIATHLGVSEATVSRDLSTVTKRALKGLDDEVLQVKVEQARQLDYVIDESLQAWRSSKEPDRQVSQRTSTASPRSAEVGAQDADGRSDVDVVDPPLVTTTRVREQVGDKGFLQTAMTAMREKRRILGAEAPVKVAQTDPSGEQEANPGRSVVVVLPDNHRGDAYDRGQP